MLIIKDDWCSHCLADLLGHSYCGRQILDLGQHHHEFVTPEPGDNVAPAQDRHDPVRGDPRQMPAQGLVQGGAAFGDVETAALGLALPKEFASMLFALLSL